MEFCRDDVDEEDVTRTRPIRVKIPEGPRKASTTMMTTMKMMTQPPLHKMSTTTRIIANCAHQVVICFAVIHAAILAI